MSLRVFGQEFCTIRRRLHNKKKILRSELFETISVPLRLGNRELRLPMKKAALLLWKFRKSRSIEQIKEGSCSQRWKQVLGFELNSVVELTS